jgi:hypothetical protein
MNKRTKFITYGAVLLALAAIFPMLRFPQLITGSVVNFVLLIACYVLGIAGGVTIGCLTPWIALIAGQMPFVYMAPFIMIGNAIYVLCFGILGRYRTAGMILGIAAGSLLKFLWLSFAVRQLVKAPPPLVQMMSIPQLITALIGGLIAFVVMKTKLLPEDILK